MARYRRGERERGWREVIRDQASIGLSISAFCRDRKLSPASFFNWRRKLAERESASVATVDARTDDGATDRSSFDCHGSLNDADIASKFVAVDFPLSAATESTDPPDASCAESARALPVAQPAAGRTGSRTSCEVVLPDGCRVVVPAGCDAVWLREILAVVREQSC